LNIHSPTITSLISELLQQVENPFSLKQKEMGVVGAPPFEKKWQQSEHCTQTLTSGSYFIPMENLELNVKMVAEHHNQSGLLNTDINMQLSISQKVG